jgi:ATP-dependent protease Clp ATPase subunit
VQKAIYCSFCGKHHDEVAKLVTGPGNVGICNECHDLMRDLMPEPPPPPTQAEREASAKDFDKWLAEQGMPPANEQ